ncbi:hypothetical protein Bpfe_001845 [Biomphalaria pfeifferi]|uniref:Uncharacterized protein n=1 Tax=Biomphalaria pfeifferi TaxID=112525 RepID=A0AAD8FL03_BIOPF|nr:hypothetical protein Bpfe_001845 [Biomphalaria pfeifferi]
MVPLLQDDKRHPASDPELPHTSVDPSKPSCVVNPNHTLNGALGDIHDEGGSKKKEVQESNEEVKNLHRCHGVYDFALENN